MRRGADGKAASVLSASPRIYAALIALLAFAGCLSPTEPVQIDPPNWNPGNTWSYRGSEGDYVTVTVLRSVYDFGDSYLLIWSPSPHKDAGALSRLVTVDEERLGRRALWVDPVSFPCSTCTRDTISYEGQVATRPLQVFPERMRLTNIEREVTHGRTFDWAYRGMSADYRATTYASGFHDSVWLNDTVESIRFRYVIQLSHLDEILNNSQTRDGRREWTR